MRGGLLLSGVICGIWALLCLITQVLVDPPLSVLPTVGIGVVLTVVVVLGYSSALRGPRGSRRAPMYRDAGGGVSDLAAAGSSVPLRAGLTPDAARRTCELLRPMLSGDAVAITDRTDILAYVGPEAGHHRAGGSLQTKVAQRAAERGRTVTASDPGGIGCRVEGCRLQSAVVVPLKVGTRVIGTLGVYQADTPPPPRRLVEDMASMLSLHLELAELDRDRRLAAHARLDALRAQINPHFLFNVLNTIASKARTRPEEARELLLRLSEFFRYTVRQEGHFAEFAQEYFYVRTYVSLEQARFGERLAVRYDIDPQVLTSRVPVLTIQPLVENAIKHGIGPKVAGGTVHLRARFDPLSRTVSIRVSDDGVGMDPAVLERLLGGRAHGLGGGEGAPGAAGPEHAGVGLQNISERLDALFGDRYALSVTAPRSGGTVIDIRVPAQ